jgi:hypothetical protein
MKFFNVLVLKVVGKPYDEEFLSFPNTSHLKKPEPIYQLGYDVSFFC